MKPAVSEKHTNFEPQRRLCDERGFGGMKREQALTLAFCCVQLPYLCPVLFVSLCFMFLVEVIAFVPDV